MSRSRCAAVPLALLLLLLCGAAEFAGACSCSPEHPQQAYCNADVVIRAKVVGRQVVVNDDYGYPIRMIRYDIKQIKMFKGPEREIDAVFTGPSSSLCGVNLEIDGKKEYLITGKMDSNDTLRVNLCDYIESWESLSLTQKKNMGQRYEMGCDCKVVQCSTIPCSVSGPAECLWTDWVMEGTVQGTQARHYTCIKRTDSSCAWYRGSAPPKSDFMDIEDP